MPEINSSIKPGTSIKKADAYYKKKFSEIMKSSLSEASKSSTSPSGRYKVDMFINRIGDAPYMTLSDSRNPDRVSVYSYGHDY